ncbi:twin-arginine translocation signal domain-containing protein [Halalkalicoccus salilacus]|uniref:twin-arginine translocation signal domain-containing protein n=1 Tax=Halalkalicoccus TaxID=332246 RepID=UPI00361C9467
MAPHDFHRRSFMQMVGVAGGTGLASSTAGGATESTDEKQIDQPSQHSGTVV